MSVTHYYFHCIYWPHTPALIQHGRGQQKYVKTRRTMIMGAILRLSESTGTLHSFHMTLEGCPHWPQLPIFYSFQTSSYFQAIKVDSKYSEEEFIKISFGKTRNPGWLKLHLQEKCPNWGHRTGLMSQQFPLLQLLLLAVTEHHRELPYPQNDNFGAGRSERQLYNHCSSKSQNLCCHPPIKNNKGFYK